MDFKKIRLFRVKKVINKVNFRLKLLLELKLYLVFYILLLELVSKDILEDKENLLSLINKLKEYEIEEILDLR